jgi:hypothetical protein
VGNKQERTGTMVASMSIVGSGEEVLKKIPRKSCGQIDHSPGKRSRIMSVTDADLQHWVEDRYDFIPSANWIAYCKETYLHEPPSPRDASDECPPEICSVIREAFVYFGLMADQQRAMVGSRI